MPEPKSNAGSTESENQLVVNQAERAVASVGGSALSVIPTTPTAPLPSSSAEILAATDSELRSLFEMGPNDGLKHGSPT